MTKKRIQDLVDKKANKKISGHLGYCLINTIEHLFRVIGCFGPKGEPQTKEVSVEVNIVPLDWLVE